MSQTTNTNLLQHLALFGGTFDPIHYGHLQVAQAVQKHFQFEKFFFLPCKRPPLKQESLAGPQQRIEMIQLALQDFPILHAEISLEEINRAGPSYMTDTLRAFRSKYGRHIAMTLLLGEDAFLNLPHWHESDQLLTLANLLIIPRTTHHSSKAVSTLLSTHETHTYTDLLHTPHGLIYQLNTDLYPISSTAIRDHVHQGKPIQKFVSPRVEAYIMENGLYRI